ncbi:hypothetical protein DQ04_10441040 [Trypanosoma grayi]|uniref:hypothetical protein n=1 Tax=Trypanosoma grayi TaxID=71804 RepID=UPI0004F45A3C|nr:hypothetical protein DQ04_10441040 [Trypanosoma grayi]KEG07247.1 hypothetical protein DQ04_10441040 [Trypanosoma grayi]
MPIGVPWPISSVGNKKFIVNAPLPNGIASGIRRAPRPHANALALASAHMSRGPAVALGRSRSSGVILVAAGGRYADEIVSFTPASRRGSLVQTQCLQEAPVLSQFASYPWRGLIHLHHDRCNLSDNVGTQGVRNYLLQGGGSIWTPLSRQNAKLSS